MKKIMLLVLFTFCAAFPQNKSLIRQATFRGDIRNFCYVSSTNTLFALTYELDVHSIIYKSTDLGATWSPLPTSPFSASHIVNGIYFLDDNTGWVAAFDSNLIYYTTNGGQTWIDRSPVNYTESISDIKFLSSTVGYACGSPVNTSNVIKTTNGGITWDTLTTPFSSTYNEMYWQDVQNGWAVGNSGHIFRTTNGGTTWTDTSVTGGTPGSLYRMVRADANTFYTFGSSGKVWKSTDGGLTFITLPAAGAQPLWSAAFADANNGIVFGSNGSAYRTTNGGNSWIGTVVFSTEVLKAAIKINNTIYVGGYRSTLFSTTDIGVTFTKLADCSRDFYSIYTENPTTYLTVGGGSGLNRGEINYTTNAGASWIKAGQPLGYFFYDGVKFGNYIYVCGQTGGYFSSSDLGNTWNANLIGTTTTNNYKLCFQNETNGYLVNNEGKIYYTTNRGLIWNAQVTFSSTTLYKIQMLSPSLGFAVGSGSRIFKTTDGTTWSHGSLATPAEALTGIFMLDSSNGYVCGQNGVIYKTTNGFQNVSLISDTTGKYGVTMRDIFAFSQNNVWAVSNKGFIYKSSSPDVMSVIDTSTFREDLMCISKLDGSSFLVSGGYGSVYKISDLTIPVELVSFSANVIKNIVTLNWSTATETNNKLFEVQRSSNNSNFITIGTISGRGTTIETSNYYYSDNAISGIYSYRLKQVDYDGSFKYSKTVEVIVNPLTYSLAQNYPNPFNPTTRIDYQLPFDSKVRLELYKITGEKVATLVNSDLSAGYYMAEINADELKLVTGVYFYKMTATGQNNQNFVQVKKLMLMK
jgi:photosystem II stability/assembly factor-like uncharacterized protein